MIEPDVSAELEEKLVVGKTDLEQQYARTRQLFELCGSPLEQKFLLRFLEARGALLDGYPCDWNGKHILIRDWGEPHFLGFDLRIYPQYVIPKAVSQLPNQEVINYRADFLFMLTRWNHSIGKTDELMQLVVEIDGHDYHERTKEQARHDKSRDRFMTASGFTVFRFTGSEVYRAVEQTIGEIADVFVAKMFEVSTSRGLRF